MKHSYSETLLDVTLAAAIKDEKTVDSNRQLSVALPYGSSFWDSGRIDDERGSVTELYDTRWDWHPDPLVFCYMFTIRPGFAKGWGLHKLHEDRYFVVDGEMEVVMYDVRPESPTCGKISRVFLSAAKPRLLNIPKFVWHADRNIGQGELKVINFPTMQYDHENPDKYRLPLHSSVIPFDFGDTRGG